MSIRTNGLVWRGIRFAKSPEGDLCWRPPQEPEKWEGVKEANVVAVAIQYRPGPFGFFKHDALNTGDPRVDSGNYGLLDQMLALSWVKKNISFFRRRSDKCNRSR